MKDIGFTEVVVVILLICAGIVIGQGFEFDKVKIGDFLAALALIATSLFAYLGLRHNKRLYLNSIRPVIEKLSITDDQNFTIEFQIQNCGTGPALHMKYEILHEGNSLTGKEFMAHMLKFGTSVDFRVEVGGPTGMTPGAHNVLLKLTDKHEHFESYDMMIKYLRNTSIKITYESVQGDVETKEFLLVEPSE